MKLKGIVFIIVPILVAALGAFLYLSLKEENVKLQIIDNKELLDKDALEWINAKSQNKGVHVLHVKGENGQSQFLIYYNKNEGKNLYSYPKINAKLKDSRLNITITDETASSEEFIKATETVYFVAKSEPSETNLYLNKEKLNIKIEKERPSRILK